MTTKLTASQVKDLPLSQAVDYLYERLYNGQIDLLGSNAKLVKSDKKGWLTKGLSLSPARTAYQFTQMDTCIDSSPGCRGGCLQFAGMNAWGYQQRLRVAKTMLFSWEKAVFKDHLHREIDRFRKSCERKNLPGALRLNVLSDLPALAVTMSREFPSLQFYDYTKRLDYVDMYKATTNVHWTLSRSELNEATCLALAHKHTLNVAVVFDGDLPEFYKGLPVLDGDESDARFLETYDKPHIIGLKLKGSKKAKAHARKTGFAVKP
jgi:hypothetical protein